MNTEPLYLKDSYLKNCLALVVKTFKDKGQDVVILDQTVFYPEGGGQPADQGVITLGKNLFKVQQVKLVGDDVLHMGKLMGNLKIGDKVKCTIDWKRRYNNMRIHSAGHVLHEAVKEILPTANPINAQHGKKAYIKYQGEIEELHAEKILHLANKLIENDLKIYTEFVSLEELQKRASWVPEHLPKNKPLRIMWIGNFEPIPDGGTQVKHTSEIGHFGNIVITNTNNESYVQYKISLSAEKMQSQISSENVNEIQKFDSENLINIKNEALAQLMDCGNLKDLEELRVVYLGKNGKFTKIVKNIKELASEERKRTGILINDAKNTILSQIAARKISLTETARNWFDPTIPAKMPVRGHLHLITKAVDEISEVFKQIGFTRSRYPEVEWDWYAFTALNFTKDHPARDDWETFFIDEKPSEKFGPMILTPHTSSGQVREMQRVKNPPIRMVNIAKCYRRQSDASHFPMFHQFEGLVVDKNISIAHLKGTLDYFARNFFGPERKTRLRPYNFPFTEPSFEVDITCDICGGKGCKVCKEGWLEIGGAGMVHPNVLKAGGIDPKRYTGFAFGWGVERAMMMKSGLKIPDLRLLYSTDLRFLRQF